MLSTRIKGSLPKNTKVNPKEKPHFVMLKDVKELEMKQSNEKVKEALILRRIYSKVSYEIIETMKENWEVRKTQDEI